MSEPEPVPRQQMVFGTQISLQSAVSILEMPFPFERTLHWIPKNTRLSATNLEVGPEDVQLVVSQEVLLATSRHVSQTLQRELGGFLLGNRYRCPTGRIYVVIDQFMEGEYTESDEVSLHFTHESWRRLEDQLCTTYLGKALVGWYHSHPKLNVFLSRDDLSIHERRFSEPWKSALVLEPEKHFGGFFCWRGERLNQQCPVDFYELLRDDTRKTVIAWENYTGVDPIKNITPALAEINTKTVQPRALSGAPLRVSGRPRSRARIVLATIAFLTLIVTATYIVKRSRAGSSSSAGQVQTGGPQPGAAAGEGPRVSAPAESLSAKEKPADGKENLSGQPENGEASKTQAAVAQEVPNPSRPPRRRPKPPASHPPVKPKPPGGGPAPVVGKKGTGD